MKSFDIDWQDFFGVLPLWDKAVYGRRRIFLDRVRDKQALDTRRWGRELSSVLGGKRGSGNEEDDFRPFRSFYWVMRGMDKIRIFESPHPSILHRYLTEHFTGEELERFGVGEKRQSFHEATLQKFVSLKWLEQFLNTNDHSWEQSYILPGGEPRLFSQEILAGSQKLIRYFLEASAPVPFKKLVSTFPEIPLSQLSVIIKACIRYLLCFPALRRDDLEPVIWVWPSTAGRFRRRQAAPPAPVAEVSSTFHAAFLMEDMVTVLVVSANESLRCRMYDGRLFARTERLIVDNLMSIPSYVEESFGITETVRISQAMHLLQYMRYLTEKEASGADGRLKPTKAGNDWLALSAKDRLKTLFDFFRAPLQKRKTLFDSYYRYDSENYFLPHVFSALLLPIHAELPGALVNAYSSLKRDGFITLRDFLEYHTAKSNPLLKFMGNGRKRADLTEETEEAMEKDWGKLLSEFLTSRMVPLGAIELGISGSNQLSFSLTDAGRYFLGLVDNFEYGVAHEEKVIVQPNFEIVFLASAPSIEATIGRFAERKGKDIGALFKITKKSILLAASTGFTVDDVMQTLRQVSAKGIPANVESDIRSWYSQCRQISVHTAVVIRCPDAETAATIISIGGKNVAPLSETVVELRAVKEKPALMKKLKTLGIFVKPQY